MKSDIENSELTREIEIHVNEIKLQVPVSDNMWMMFAEETQKHPEMRNLKLDIQNGQISGKHDGISSKLHIIDGVIFKSNRIYVPVTMRKNMIERAHEGHLGREKTKRRARSCLST